MDTEFFINKAIQEMKLNGTFSPIYSNGIQYYLIEDISKIRYYLELMVGVGVDLNNTYRICNKRSIPVAKLNKYNEIISSFPSIKIAAKRCRVSQNTIRNSIKKEFLTKAGFRWDYLDKYQNK